LRNTVASLKIQTCTFTHLPKTGRNDKTKAFNNGTSKDLSEAGVHISGLIFLLYGFPGMLSSIFPR
jgi:hypothetical protein